MNIASYLKNRQLCVLSVGLLTCCSSLPLYAGVTGKAPITNQVRTKIQVKGVVTDKSGEPLIGATIVEKASGNGTIADPRTGTSTWQSRRMPCLKSALSGISPSKSK